MKVELKHELKEVNGETIFLQNEKGEITSDPMTIAFVFNKALSIPLKGDENDSDAQRMKKFNLLQSIFKNEKGKLNVTSEDVTLIKNRVRKVFANPVIYGRVCEALGEIDND